MSMSLGENSGSEIPKAEINVTPLADVMLVLLIIFMITAPLMSHKIKVTLPKADPNEKPTEVRVAPVDLAVPGDDVHVLAVGAHVAGGDVAAAEGGDEPAVGAQQRLGLDLGGVADDDSLAAAVVQAGQCVLVGHGDRQAQHVG